MLRKTQRLSKNRVEFILKKGQLRHTDFFNLKFLPNQLQFNRYSITISKKTIKTATGRNRLRRQISEILRLNQSPTKNGQDFAIIIKPKLLDQSSEQLKHNLLNLINQETAQI
jgi:ribonuclease P protein component